jgi:succinoglycan biosynthesis protein ExoA
MSQLRLAPAPAAPLAPLPFVSVIVPVRNEQAFIAGTLGQLLRQDYPRDQFEILVADGRSDDDTRAVVEAVARRDRRVRLLDNPGRLSSAGRNVAVRAAEGDLIVLIDGHCELGSPRYLRELVDAFRRSGADCVGRPQPLDVTGATPLQLAVARARSSRLGHHPASFIYSGEERFVPPESVAVAYRREVFARVGLFDERFDACEDVELNHRVARAGLRCFFTPRAAVRYHPRDTLRGLYRQLVRYGRGRVRLLRKHPDTFSPAAFVPALFLAGLLAGPALACLWPALWWACAAAFALYAGVVAAWSVGLAAQEGDLRLLPWLPAVFATVHLAAGVGVWWEVLESSPPLRGGGKNRRPAAGYIPERRKEAA